MKDSESSGANISNNCVNISSIGLWLNGVPALGIAPVFTHASLLLRQSSIYNHSFYIGF